MRALIQRVSRASVTIHDEISGEIGRGLVVFIGIEEGDQLEDIQWIVKKIANMRIFNDGNEVMNLSANDQLYDVLAVSQFTLHANNKKGNRPSYIRAAKPEVSIPIYTEFLKVLRRDLHGTVETGEFGADMQVELVNDGPVTIWLDSKAKSY